MILINDKLPNFKMAFGDKIVATDAKGQIEAKEKDIIDSLKASGFVEAKVEKAVEKKTAKAKEEIKEQVEQAEVSEEVSLEAATEDKVEKKSKKSHWKYR